MVLRSRSEVVNRIGLLARCKSDSGDAVRTQGLGDLRWKAKPRLVR
jgi:hypothetical protein